MNVTITKTYTTRTGNRGIVGKIDGRSFARFIRRNESPADAVLRVWGVRIGSRSGMRVCSGTVTPCGDAMLQMVESSIAASTRLELASSGRFVAITGDRAFVPAFGQVVNFGDLKDGVYRAAGSILLAVADGAIRRIDRREARELLLGA